MSDKSKYKSTAQEFLEIYDITNDLVILKNGTAGIILEVSAMNFGLLAEEEQDAVIYTYAALLNSLNYPIQIIIQSQTKDVTKYLGLLKEQEEESVFPQKRERIARYREFVTNLIKERNVLDKKFFVVIPATALELELLSAESVIPGRDTFDVTKYEKTVLIDKAQAILEPRRDHLISQFARIGLSAWQLPTQDIIRVFYTNYNPEASEGFEGTNTEEYQTAMVRANLMQNLDAMRQDQTELAQGQRLGQQPNQDNFLPADLPAQQLAQPNLQDDTQVSNEDGAQENLAGSTVEDQPKMATEEANRLDQDLDNQYEQQANQLHQAFEENGQDVQSTVGSVPQEQPQAAENNPIAQDNQTAPTPPPSFQESIPDFPTEAVANNPTPTNQAVNNTTQESPNPHQEELNNTLKEVGAKVEIEAPADSKSTGAPTTPNNEVGVFEQPNQAQPTNSNPSASQDPPPIPEIQ